MTGAEVCARASILNVWAALGGPPPGPPPHGKRYQAFYRNGGGFNVTLSDEKNTWFDFAAGTGGGILDLIVAVRDCSRRDALRWLAGHLGVELDGSAVDSGRAVDHRVRWRVAEARARELANWRASLLQSLTTLRNAAWDTERAVSAWARDNLSNPAVDADWKWEAVWTHAQDDRHGDEIAAEIERIEKMEPTELLALRAEMEMTWAAA